MTDALSNSLLDAINAVPDLRVSSQEQALPTIHSSNSWGESRVLLQGAQLLEWAPHGQTPAVWLSPNAKWSPDKSPRGGVPICWPWFGPHETKEDYPPHGIVRAASWQLIKANLFETVGHELHFRWVPGLSHNDYWPFNTPLDLRYTLGDSCEIELITRNDSPTTVTMTEALHTYLGVGDVREVTIRGLEDFEYLDKVNDNRRQHQSGPITISGETDRVYLSTQSDCFIEDPLLKRIIRIEKRGSQSTIVWNPWEEKARRLGDLGETDFLRMVCVESGNVAENRITLKPGEEHRLWVRYSVSALTT